MVARRASAQTYVCVSVWVLNNIADESDSLRRRSPRPVLETRKLITINIVVVLQQLGQERQEERERDELLHSHTYASEKHSIRVNLTAHRYGKNNDRLISTKT